MDSKAASFFSLGLVTGLILAAVAMALFVKRPEAGDKAKVLKLAHLLPPAAPVHKGMVYMADRLEEISGGQLKVVIFHSGQLGSEPESLGQLQRGAIAMVKTSAAAMENFIPDFAVFGVPYLFEDEDHFWRVMESPIGEEFLEMGASIGIRGICYYDAGARSFYTTGKPILTPADLQGMKIRTMESTVSMDMVDVMGGSPTPMPFGDLYTSLQQGMVDGAENNPPSLYDSRHWEVAKHYSLSQHQVIPDILVFSESIWQTLTPQEQQWVKQAAEESVAYQRKVWDEYVAECMERLVNEGGVKVYHPEKEPFLQAVQPIYDSFKGGRVGALIERIQQMKD